MRSAIVIGSRSRRRSRRAGLRIEKVAKPGRSLMWTFLIAAAAATALPGTIGILSRMGPGSRADEVRIEIAQERVADASERMREAADLTSRCEEARIAVRPMLEDGDLSPSDLGTLKGIAFARCRIG